MDYRDALIAAGAFDALFKRLDQVITDAAAYDRARLCAGLIGSANTASDVRADTAYCSAENERYLANSGKVSRIDHKTPKGKAMP